MIKDQYFDFVFDSLLLMMMIRKAVLFVLTPVTRARRHTDSPARAGQAEGVREARQPASSPD